MSQAWIKVENITIEKVEVARIAAKLGMDRFAVLGRLIRIWGYWDQHSQDGHIGNIGVTLVDELVAHSGFCAQLVEVGWAQIHDDGITLPNFKRHNGETAKTRAMTARRVEKHRSGSQKRKRYKSGESGNADCNGDVTPEPLPEERRGEKIRGDKRREEINAIPPLTPQGGKRGSKQK